MISEHIKVEPTDRESLQLAYSYGLISYETLAYWLKRIGEKVA